MWGAVAMQTTYIIYICTYTYTWDYCDQDEFPIIHLLTLYFAVLQTAFT